MFFKLLSMPFRIANIPARAVEKIVGEMCGGGDIPKGDRILSMPLDKLAETIEELDEE